jgi:NitT/TauT family transport system substrate-binding protein
VKARFIAALAALILLLPPAAGTQELATVIVGGSLADDTVALWYAIDNGLFRRAGLNVEYQRTPTGAVATLGAIGGSFHFAVTNALSLLQAHVRNVPLEYVAPSGAYNSTTEFLAAVVKKDSPLQTGRDLNGKLIGTGSVRDLNAVALMSWMDQHGGDSKTIRTVEIPMSATQVALEEGRIEVATLYQPFLANALNTGKIRVFAQTYDAIAPRFVLAVWVSMPAYTSANPTIVRRFAQVIREAGIWANTHRAESAAIVAKYTGIDAAVIRAGGRDTFATNFADPRDLQPLIDSAAKYGGLERAFNATELISPPVRGLTP